MPNYRYEICGNPEYVELHFTFRVTKEMVTCIFASEAPIEQQELIELLGSANGVDSFHLLQPYSATVKRGAAFEGTQVAENLLQILKIWAIAKGIVNDSDPWIQLPTIRSDIRNVLCSACYEAQLREIRETMKEFESLDW